MFGIGPKEVVVIGLLFLVLCGPGKSASMARDVGHFVKEARDFIEEFKAELLSEEQGDHHHRHSKL